MRKFQDGERVLVYANAHTAANAASQGFQGAPATIVREMPYGVAERGQPEYEIEYQDGAEGDSIVPEDRLRPLA